MKPIAGAKKLVQSALDPLETLNSQLGRPILEEMGTELGAFFGAKPLSRNPKTIAQEDLSHARQAQKIDKMQSEDEQKSKQTEEQVVAYIHSEYKAYEQSQAREQHGLKQELFELQEEVGKLAKAAGVETKAHMETPPKKIGLLDIKRLTAIVRYLRLKTEESKSAQELVVQRSNAKQATGMLAWVSGKQMKVHEQGTLQLQG